MNNKGETDANILKVQNSNPILEFVANQPLQNMFLNYFFGIFTWFIFGVRGNNPGGGINDTHCKIDFDQGGIITNNGKFHTSPNMRVASYPVNTVIQKYHVELPDGTTMNPYAIIIFLYTR